jgi:alkylation response protein AidB-like acyl-CoA dehydrogenase
VQLKATVKPLDWTSIEAGLLQAVPLIAARANGLEQTGADLAQDLDLLARIGLLAAALPSGGGGLGLGLGHSAQATLWTVTVLRRLGRANLSVARLFEGHLNALKLVELHAAPATGRRLVARAEAGAVFGIWGADGATPVRLHPRGDGSYRLSGAKAFASGLGLVDVALITTASASDPDQLQLVAIDASDPDRQHPEQWTAAAMRATRSGGFVLDDLVVTEGDLVGGPEDYLVEPHFDGGIWRYCAAHIGGAEALVEALRQSLIASGRASDVHQLERLARAAARCEAGRRLVETAAVTVEASRSGTPAEIDAAVAHALVTRELVEEACVEVMTLVERSLGVRAHVAGSSIERQRRDLGLYLRQAAPDAKLQRAGRLIASSPAAVGEQW